MTDRPVTAPYTDEAIRRVVREWAKLDRASAGVDTRLVVPANSLKPGSVIKLEASTPPTILFVRSHAPDLARTLDQLLAEYRGGR